MSDEVIVKSESENIAGEVAAESVTAVIEVAEVLAEEKAEATVALVALQAEIAALHTEVFSIREAFTAHEVSNTTDFQAVREQVQSLELGLAGLTAILEDTADEVEEMLREELREELSEAVVEPVAIESGEVPANVEEHLDTTTPGEEHAEEQRRKRHFVRI